MTDKSAGLHEESDFSFTWHLTNPFTGASRMWPVVNAAWISPDAGGGCGILPVTVAWGEEPDISCLVIVLLTRWRLVLHLLML